MGTRNQATVHLNAEAKKWLTNYATSMNMKESEVLRLLVQREREVKWLKWAVTQPDPAQTSKTTPLKGPDAPLPKLSENESATETSNGVVKGR